MTRLELVDSALEDDDDAWEARRRTAPCYCCHDARRCRQPLLVVSRAATEASKNEADQLSVLAAFGAA